MPSLRDLSTGMYGAWRLALLDRGAISAFDRSPQAVLRSFWAAAIAYPPFLVWVAWSLAPGDRTEHGLTEIFLLQSIGYSIGWMGFPLLVLPFCRWLDREAEAYDFIIAYNWWQVIEYCAVLLLLGLRYTPFFPTEAADWLLGIAYFAFLAYEWFIARVALDSGRLAAAAVVLIGAVLSLMIERITTLLY